MEGERLVQLAVQKPGPPTCCCHRVPKRVRPTVELVGEESVAPAHIAERFKTSSGYGGERRWRKRISHSRQHLACRKSRNMGELARAQSSRECFFWGKMPRSNHLSTFLSRYPLLSGRSPPAPSREQEFEPDMKKCQNTRKISRRICMFRLPWAYWNQACLRCVRVEDALRELLHHGGRTTGRAHRWLPPLEPEAPIVWLVRVPRVSGRGTW